MLSKAGVSRQLIMVLAELGFDAVVGGLYNVRSACGPDLP